LLQPRESGRDGRVGVGRSAADDGDAQRATVELDTVVSSDGALRLGIRREFNLSGTLASTVRAVVDSRLDDSSDLGEEFLRMVANGEMKRDETSISLIQKQCRAVETSCVERRIHVRVSRASRVCAREMCPSVCLCLPVRLNRTISETNSKKLALAWKPKICDVLNQ
jgi:hypothetical protein